MVCWGLAYVPSAWLTEDLPPLSAAAARLGAGGLLVLAVVAARGRSLHPGTGIATVLWLGLTQTAIFYGATFWGIVHGGAGLAAVLANTDPLFVAVLSVAFLGERLTGRQWSGLGLGFAGAALAVLADTDWPPRVSGAAMVVIAGALGWAVGTIVVARGVRGTGDPLPLAGWQMLAGALMLGVLGALETGPRELTPRALGLVLVLAVVGSALPMALFYTALTRGPAGEVSAWFFLVPVVGVLTAWPLLGERPGALLLGGMALVSVGLWLVLGRRPPRAGLVASDPAR
jgi:drug/metabolite transporter (DMT)-like permease